MLMRGEERGRQRTDTNRESSGYNATFKTQCRKARMKNPKMRRRKGPRAFGAAGAAAQHTRTHSVRSDSPDSGTFRKTCARTRRPLGSRVRRQGGPAMPASQRSPRAVRDGRPRLQEEAAVGQAPLVAARLGWVLAHPRGRLRPCFPVRVATMARVQQAHPYQWLRCLPWHQRLSSKGPRPAWSRTPCRRKKHGGNLLKIQIIP